VIVLGSAALNEDTERKLPVRLDQAMKLAVT
jgi:hypothetical protein